METWTWRCSQGVCQVPQVPYPWPITTSHPPHDVTLFSSSRVSGSTGCRDQPQVLWHCIRNRNDDVPVEWQKGNHGHNGLDQGLCLLGRLASARIPQLKHMAVDARVHLNVTPAPNSASSLQLTVLPPVIFTTLDFCTHPPVSKMLSSLRRERRGKTRPVSGGKWVEPTTATTSHRRGGLVRFAIDWIKISWRDLLAMAILGAASQAVRQPAPTLGLPWHS